jgi:hypothetical protein
MTTTPHTIDLSVTLEDLAAGGPTIGHVHAWYTDDPDDRVVVTIYLGTHLRLTGSPALGDYLRDAADRVDAEVAALRSAGPGNLVEGGALAGGEGGDV